MRLRSSAPTKPGHGRERAEPHRGRQPLAREAHYGLGSVSEIGCIHTCQGLELDYVGVVIGPDLVVRDGEVVTDAGERDRYDSTVRGYKQWLREDPDAARAAARQVILNTYRTLMSRGMRGCWVWSVDEETRDYLKVAAEGTSRSRRV